MSSIVPASMQQLSNNQMLPEITIDRAVIVNKFRVAAKELFSAPDGLNVQNINSLNVKALDLVLQFPEGARMLFGGPDGISTRINEIPESILKLLLQSPSAARMLSGKPDFDAEPFLSLPLESLDFCLQHAREIKDLHDSPNGLTSAEMLKLEEELNRRQSTLPCTNAQTIYP